MYSPAASQAVRFMWRWLPTIAVSCFVLGVVPLLALAFFSPGLGSEGIPGLLVGLFGAATLVALTLAARRMRPLWILVAFQALLLVALIVQAFSDARLYLGT